MLCRNVCGVSNNLVSNECDILDKACIQQMCDESELCVQQNDVEKEIKYAEQFRSRCAMGVNCNINNREYHVRSRRIPVKGKLERSHVKTQKLDMCMRILKNILVSSTMYRYIKCRLKTRIDNDSIKFVKKMRKKWHITRSTLQRKSTI